MAEANLLEMLQDIITCSICVEEANDPRPLTCQHTFCLQCLKTYIQSKERQDEVECPVCRKVCRLPNGNVENLPASFVYTQLKDANAKCTAEKKKGTAEDNKRDREEARQEQEHKTKLVCSSDECQQIAKVFCKTCKYICSECEAEHRNARSLKAHVILTLNEAANLKKNEFPHCSKHHEERLKLFCEECDIPICYMGKSVDHSNHECVELISKADREKFKLGQAMKTTKSHLKKTSEMSELITLHSAKLRENAANIKCQVGKRAEEIIREVKDREKAIIQDVEENYKQADKALEGEADKVNLVQGVLQSHLYHIVLLYLHGSQYELVTKDKSIEQTIQDNDPDDMKLDIPELDTSEAELKLQDFKTYEELQEHFKQTCLALELHKSDSEKEKIEQKKAVEDLEDQLRTEKKEKENTFTNIQHQLKHERDARKKAVKDLEDQLQKGTEEREKAVKDLEDQLQKRKEEKEKAVKDLEDQLQKWKEETEKARKISEHKLQDGEEEEEKIIDDPETQLKLEKEARENTCNERQDECVADSTSCSTTTEQCSVGSGHDSSIITAGKHETDNVLVPLIPPQPVGGTWTQGTSFFGHPTITCTFPAGIQSVSHPRPGQPYPASTLTCWIHKGDGGPSRPVGAVVAALIRRAFDARLLFTVRGDQVAWHGVVLFSGDRIHKPHTIKRLSELGIKL